MILELELLITGLSLLCVGATCPGMNADEATVLFVDATESSWACSRPFCAAGTVHCDHGGTPDCQDGSRVCDGEGLKCVNSFVVCSDNSIPCVGSRLICPNAGSSCRALDGQPLGFHRPVLIFDTANLSDETKIDFSVVIGPGGESLGVIDLSGTCIEIDTLGGLGRVEKAPGQGPGDREPNPAGYPAEGAFGWAMNLRDFNRDIIDLDPQVNALDQHEVKVGLVKARLNITSGLLGSRSFRRDNQQASPRNYLRYLACPDRRPVQNPKAFPKALPEFIVLNDNIVAEYGVKIRACSDGGSGDVLVQLEPPESGPSKIILTVGNLPINTRVADVVMGPRHYHFRWLYDLVKLDQDYITDKSLPVPTVPTLGVDPEANYECDEGAASGNMFCQPTTYP